MNLTSPLLDLLISYACFTFLIGLSIFSIAGAVIVLSGVM